MENNIRIIVKTNKGGIYTDALIFHQTINSIYPKLAYIVVHDTVKSDELSKKTNINIYIEHNKYGEGYQYPAKYNLLAINPEMITDWDFKYFSNIDFMLCKTKYTAMVVDDLEKRYKFPFKIVYTNFTSLCHEEIAKKVIEDNNLIKNNNIVKDNNLVIHFAGQSPFKNTQAVLRAWIKNNGFIDVNPNVVLLISRWQLFNLDDIRYWNSLPTKPIDEFHGKKLNNGKQYKNIIVTEKMDFENVIYFMLVARYAICPSFIEGWGHYINESRCYRNYVIATDAPPMNELITDRSGTLVPYYKTTPSYVLVPYFKWIFKDVITTAFYIDYEKLGKAIAHVLNMDQTDIDKKVERAYDDFVKDTKEFENIIIALIKTLK